MDSFVFRYTFNDSVDIAEVRATVTLSLLATESLHGESGVQLEGRYTFDPLARKCVIDASGEIGRDLNRLFLGFINREFGTGAFRVERVESAESKIHATT